MDESTLRERVAAAVGARPVGVTDLAGGEVGRVRRLDFDDRDPLVAKTGPTPLAVEAEMLRYLARESSLPVPAVRSAADDLLVLSFVEGDALGPRAATEAVERDVAGHLAALHGVTADASGFPFDTLSGAYAQPNPWTDRGSTSTANTD